MAGMTVYMLNAALPAMAEETTQAAGKTPVVDFENRETSQLDSSAAETVLSESTPPETEISSQEISDAQKLEVRYSGAECNQRGGLREGEGLSEHMLCLL